MMESRPNGGRLGGALTLCVVLSSGCRMGLPPEPPGADATDPEAVIPEYQASPDPFTTSAFAGETLGAGEGHQGHQGHQGHGGHQGPEMPASKEPQP